MWQLLTEYWPIIRWVVGTLCTGAIGYAIKRGYPAAIRASKAQVGKDMCAEELALVYHQLAVLRKQMADLPASSCDSDQTQDSQTQS